MIKNLLQGDMWISGDNYVDIIIIICYALDMKVKCECINCGHIQYVEKGEIVDCEMCGKFVNSNEDKI